MRIRNAHDLAVALGSLRRKLHDYELVQFLTDVRAFFRRTYARVPTPARWAALLMALAGLAVVALVSVYPSSSEQPDVPAVRIGISKAATVPAGGLVMVRDSMARFHVSAVFPTTPDVSYVEFGDPCHVGHDIYAGCYFADAHAFQMYSQVVLAYDNSRFCLLSAQQLEQTDWDNCGTVLDYSVTMYDIPPKDQANALFNAENWAGCAHARTVHIGKFRGIECASGTYANDYTYLAVRGNRLYEVLAESHDVFFHGMPPLGRRFVASVMIG